MTRTGLTLLVALALGSPLACKRDKVSPPPAPVESDTWREDARASIEKGIAFLASRDPDGKGIWMQSAGITAVVVLAHFQSPLELSPDTHAYLFKALKYLQSLQRPNGAIYEEREGNANYVTSVSMLAMILSGDARFSTTVDQARTYLVESQMADTLYEGGFGYQDKARVKDKPYADIVNTEFALEALSRAGLPEDHECWKRAVRYLERSQHNSEYNDAKWVTDVGEYRGGFVYHPGGESKAESATTSEGENVLLPYGSVTYAGIKSMIYAHLDRKDPRVLAAVDWIRRHWTLEENPGFDVSRDKNLGMQGYFYYFTTFAKALHALGVETIVDKNRVEHPWRRELVARLVSLQKPDGSWKNEWHDRWYESHEEIATSYATIALSFALMGP